jgi:hypothetical protein
MNKYNINHLGGNHRHFRTYFIVLICKQGASHPFIPDVSKTPLFSGVSFVEEWGSIAKPQVQSLLKPKWGYMTPLMYKRLDRMPRRFK